MCGEDAIVRWKVHMNGKLNFKWLVIRKQLHNLTSLLMRTFCTHLGSDTLEVIIGFLKTWELSTR